VKAGPPIDPTGGPDGEDDHDGLVAMTAEVMAALTVLVEDLRARYPKRWAADR
jgi:hypothetical protein